jgi:hypothetical protein
MGKEIKVVYNVERSNTTKTTKVGDFDKLENAKKAMVNHFNITPKRGNFEYTICQEHLEDCNGIIMRTFSRTLFSKNENDDFYKRYSRAEIEKMSV